MALVHNQQPVIFGEVIHQCLWRSPRVAPGEMTRVVLDALGERTERGVRQQQKEEAGLASW